MVIMEYVEKNANSSGNLKHELRSPNAGNRMPAVYLYAGTDTVLKSAII